MMAEVDASEDMQATFAVVKRRWLREFIMEIEKAKVDWPWQRMATSLKLHACTVVHAVSSH